MLPDEPSADPTSAWMKHLERAHERAHAAARAIGEEPGPSAHLAPAARHLERGLTAMYDAFDGRADRPTALGLAHARLWNAAILVAREGLVGTLSTLRDACGELIAAEERYPRLSLAGQTSSVLEASVDHLPLHTVMRPSLSPSLRAPRIPDDARDLPPIELPDPTTFEELAAVARSVRGLVAERTNALTARASVPVAERVVRPIPPGFAFAPPDRIEQDAFVRRLARECLDEIGMLGLQRSPLPGDDWRACQGLERRLLAVVDAIAALGPAAVAHVEPHAMDAPAADAMRVFAAALLGGCIAGRDVLACAERVLHRFGPGDPLVAEPFVAAMKLAPNPFVPGVMRALLASPDSDCQAIAVEVLAYRGWLSQDELATLADTEDARLFALALPALGAARHPDFARAVERALGHPDLAVKEAALDAMAIGTHPGATEAARAAAGGAVGDRALVRLAIVAREADARWLASRLRERPCVATIEAAGWAGLLDAVGPLMDVLESGDEPERLAAGAALDRLLGANLVEEIEIMPEALDDVIVVDPDPGAKPPPKTLAELVSDPRDRPSAGSTETLEVPSTDPSRWRAYWAEHGARLDPKVRIRRGHAHSASVSLYELDQLALSAADRRTLHRELAAKTGRVTHFDPHDFVAVQERSLKAWADIVRAAVETPGAFARGPRREA